MAPGHGGLVGVELDEAVEGVGVAHHGENDGVALVDGDLIDVGEVERVRCGRVVLSMTMSCPEVPKTRSRCG